MNLTFKVGIKQPVKLSHIMTLDMELRQQHLYVDKKSYY